MTTLRGSSILLVSFALVIVPFLGGVTPSFAQVMASDVMDRSTLRTFVERATALTESEVSSASGTYAFFDRTFRPMGEWHRGPIYIFAANTQGVIRFHAASRSLEGRNLYNDKDKNGVYYVRELIAAAEAGGDFVEYLFDNPDVQGDEEEGSPKVSYVMLLDLPGEKLIIGSGYYPAIPTPIAPPLALLALATLLLGGAYRRWRPIATSPDS